MLLGEHEYKLDDKGRIAIPPKYRHKFREGGVLAQGLENCILVYPLLQWRKMTEALTFPSLKSAKERRINRYLFGTASEFEIDGQGRITLPLFLRRYAGIQDTAIIVGVNTYLEIWSEENWQTEKKFLDEHIEQLVESVEMH